MRINVKKNRPHVMLRKNRGQQGVTLVELIVFIVVVSISLLVLVGVFNRAAVANADPLIRVRALESAQSMLDQVIALKYDANTPSGGVPACGTASAVACNNSSDSDMNDVDDYDGWTDAPYPNFSRSVTVTTNSNLKTITVSVTAPGGVRVVLAAQRANF